MLPSILSANSIDFLLFEALPCAPFYWAMSDLYVARFNADNALYRNDGQQIVNSTVYAGNRTGGASRGSRGLLLSPLRTGTRVR